MPSVRELRRTLNAGVACVGTLLAAPLVAGCDRTAPPPPAARLGDAPDNVHPLAVADPELAAACDTLEQLLGSAMPGRTTSHRGSFAHGVQASVRYGCSLAAADTLQADTPVRPLDRAWTLLEQRAWSVDPAWVAEGPEGRMAGFRRGSLLCVLQHFWNVGSDDERAADWATPVWYEARVECFREPPRTSPGS
jgi:hypothetical protein